MHRDDTLLADAVVLALLVALDAHAPEERLAFLLRGLFGLPDAEIAALLGAGEAGAP
jgi:RNA polymerase sigma-70 factor (ECF subfamily)